MGAQSAAAALAATAAKLSLRRRSTRAAAEPRLDERRVMPSYAESIKGLFRKYGRVAIGVHFSVYFVTLSGCYLAAERNSGLEKFFVRQGLLSQKELSADSDPEKRGWMASALTSSGSSLALAFLCTKALLPIRVPLTLAITPPIARLFRGASAPAAQAARSASQQQPGRRE